MDTKDCPDVKFGSVERNAPKRTKKKKSMWSVSSYTKSCLRFSNLRRRCITFWSDHVTYDHTRMKSFPFFTSDLSGPGSLVKALRVSLLAHIQRCVHEDFEEREACCFVNLSRVQPVLHRKTTEMRRELKRSKTTNSKSNRTIWHYGSDV